MNEENKCDIGRQLQDSLQCSASKTPLNNLDENFQIIILAEILLTKSNFTSKLNICVDHKEIILQNVSKRQRRKRCGIGDTPIFRFHHQGKGADRHVTADMCSNIHQSIGVIIPVGTRKYLDTCIQYLSLYHEKLKIIFKTTNYVHVQCTCSVLLI